MCRCGQKLSQLGANVLRSTLASFWHSSGSASRVGGDEAERHIEDIVFASATAAEPFLVDLIEPQLEVDRRHVFELYKLREEDRLRSVVGELAIRWPRTLPRTNQATQADLLQIAIERAPAKLVVSLVEERLKGTAMLGPEQQRLGISAAFLVDFEGKREIVRKFCKQDADHL